MYFKGGAAEKSAPLAKFSCKSRLMLMEENPNSVLVKHEKLFEFAVDCFLCSGFAEEKARLIANTLIEADLRGLNTHGVIRIPMYLNRVRRGLINPLAETKVVVANDNMAILDAGNGMGQPCSFLAMNLAMEKAAASTIGMVGVRNSNHFGAAAYYTMMAAERQMVGICCSNTEPLMAAPGGAKAVVGNNPLSLAFPGGDKPAIVIDMAMSAAAIGKIVLAQKKGESIPLGWATDKRGNNTSEPNAALDGGTLLPFAGPKGYGLALAVDILAGILTGSGFGQGVKSPFNDFLHQQNVGHMFMALNIASFMPVENFLGQVEKLITEIKAAPTANGVNEVYLPGEIEFNTKALRLAAGIPLPVSLLEELEAYGNELGVKYRLEA